ncbi:MAG: hypothetical protein JNG85_14185, partial [Spirochaetaceae bacterium]|nr:hypothetical protein [Spirochaetaceae bacterium]
PRRLDPGSFAALEVRGPVLKFELVTAFFDLVDMKERKSAWRSPEKLRRAGPEGAAYADFLDGAWEALGPDGRAAVATLSKSSPHPWRLLDTLARLPDDAEAAEIIAALKALPTGIFAGGWKAPLAFALDKFYAGSFREYYAREAPLVAAEARRVGETMSAGLPEGVLAFMAEEAGVPLDRNRKVAFYYTFQVIGAFGFEAEGIKISTVQRTSRSPEDLYGTAFHEFGHEVFRTFQGKAAFVAAADKLKADKRFLEDYESTGRANYGSWANWCVENLVNGFSYWLGYRKFGAEPEGGNYRHDAAFFAFLKEKGFAPSPGALEKSCIDFLEASAAKAGARAAP